jgi:hypothetical protein
VSNVQKGKIIPITRRASRQTESGFILLSEAAGRGEIIGAAYVVLTPDMETRHRWFGEAEHNPALAYYKVQRLS